MLVIRPITQADYPALHQCAVESGHGFTSLPVNEEQLRNRIDHSTESFEKEALSPGLKATLWLAKTRLPVK